MAYPYYPYSSGTTLSYQWMPNMVRNSAGGYQGNPSQNLQEVQAVQEELRRRHPNGAAQRQVSPNTDFFSITDRNEERLFKPVVPANRFIHEDDHIEWLKGRTRSVCSRIKWAKSTYAQ